MCSMAVLECAKNPNTIFSEVGVFFFFLDEALYYYNYYYFHQNVFLKLQEKLTVFPWKCYQIKGRGEKRLFCFLFFFEKLKINSLKYCIFNRDWFI